MTQLGSPASRPLRWGALLSLLASAALTWGCQGGLDLPGASADSAPRSAPAGWEPKPVPPELQRFAKGREGIPLAGTDLRFTHAAHVERGASCNDCHEGAANGKRAGFPKMETCQDCHDGLDRKGKPTKACAVCHARPDLEVRWRRPAALHDVKFDHRKHQKADVACAVCHGAVDEAVDHEALAPLPSMSTCVECHEKKGASTDCATCHVKTRADAEPASHGSPAWREGHGAVWARSTTLAKGDSARCDGCHTAEACRTCHEKTRPASHRSGGWRRAHGDEARVSGRTDSAPVRCAVCHRRTECDACHQSAAPRDHNNVWRRFSHGAEAGIDRDRCTTCHQTDSCERCHSQVTPTSHTGGFTRSPSATHCVGCHQPIKLNACAACHRQADHRSAPTRPLDARHQTATEAGCRTCHGAGLRHPDNGDSCRSCH